MRPMRCLLIALVLLQLGACGTLSSRGADRTQDACTRNGSPVNPAALASGLGGTGAPATAVVAQPGGMGGTGQVAQRPGLGGTGQVAQGGEGGLGGTGIVGVVTGFGSICVNGLKVDYTPDTPVQRDGQPVPVSALAVGQVVALQASAQGQRLQAGRIAVLDAAVGPLGTVDAATGRFTVLGEAATALVPADLAGLAPGQWVRVSGQRRASGEIRATRVQATAPGSAWVSGTLARTTTGGWQVGRTPLAAGAASLPATGAAGQEVAVQGVWTGDRLQATAITVEPTRAALGPVRDVVLQGYVHGLSGRELTLGFETLTLGSVLQVLGGQLDALRSGQPVLVRGQRDAQQRLVVDRLEFRNEGGRGGSRGTTSRSGRDDSDSDDDSGDDADDRDGDDSGSGSSGSGSDSDSSGKGSGKGSGSSSSGSGSSGSGSSGSGSSGSGSSGSGSSGSGSSGSGSSGSGSGGDSGGRGRGRGRGGD